MKELELKAIRDLEEFYTLYLKEGINEILKYKAKEIESRYLNISPLVSQTVMNALCSLTDFYAPTGIKPISKRRAQKLLEELLHRKAILCNEGKGYENIEKCKN